MRVAAEQILMESGPIGADFLPMCHGRVEPLRFES
jgi:hypothetical protein